MITFTHTTTILDQIELSAALQQAHWEELATNKAAMKLAPAMKQYAALEHAGILFAVLAYDGDKLIGYSVNFMAVNLHYSALLMAQNDVLFVAKKYRTGRTGLRLMQETEQAAQKRGAGIVLWHAKEGTPLAGILPRMGYKVQDVLFSKAIEQSNFRSFGDMDVTAAREEALNSDLWDIFTARQTTPGSPHHDTRCILLRGPDADFFDANVVFNMVECRDSPAIASLPATTALCAAACDRLRVEQLGRVMLVELAPGGHIDLHSDEGDYAAHYERFHLVLTSEPGNEFHNGGQVLHMQPGELWRFNHRKQHEVFNRSASPRIHLIIDAVTS